MIMKNYLNNVYEIVKKESEGLDSIYEDYILYLVGMIGLLELQKHKLLETCGVVNGRQMYVLVDKKQ